MFEYRVYVKMNAITVTQKATQLPYVLHLFPCLMMYIIISFD